MKNAQIVFPGIDGNVVLKSFTEDEEKVVMLYGDRKGLKSLAQHLTSIADLDQNALPEINLPKGHGYHLHLNPGAQLNVESEFLIIGRLDGKITGDAEWMSPPVLLRNKPPKEIIEILG